MSDNNPRSSGWLGPWCLLVGVILLVTGLFFAIGGFKLVSWGELVFSHRRGYHSALCDSVLPPQVLCRGAVCPGVSWHPDLGIFRCRARLLAAGFPFNGTRRADGAGSCHLACIA